MYNEIKVLTTATYNGLIGLCLSVTSSTVMDVTPLYIVDKDNIVNIITQSAILIATITTFILKYRELKQIKKNKNKKDEN